MSAYAIWGTLPLYWTLLGSAPALEVLAHRVVWSWLFVATLALALARRTPASLRPFTWRARFGLLAAALLISTNWGAYIWAVNNGQVLEASLGYFMTPLATTALGVVGLGERLRPTQWVSVAISVAAVLIAAMGAAGVPWLALLIAGTFGGYGLAKKTAGSGAVHGLALETLLMAPLAVAYLAYLGLTGAGTLTTQGAGHAALLVSTGLVTVVPLLLFGAAAPRLPMTTLGVLQYFPPSIQFVLGLTVFDEPISHLRLLAFGLVWLSLLLFSASSFAPRARPSAREPGSRLLEPHLGTAPDGLQTDSEPHPHAGRPATPGGRRAMGRGRD